jgi:hypothetical protein
MRVPVGAIGARGTNRVNFTMSEAGRDGDLSSHPRTKAFGTLAV